MHCPRSKYLLKSQNLDDYVVPINEINEMGWTVLLNKYVKNSVLHFLEFYRFVVEFNIDLMGLVTVPCSDIALVFLDLHGYGK